MDARTLSVDLLADRTDDTPLKESSSPTPYLSVIIPTFNEAATLSRVIDAVLDVDESIEIILVDDGSTDTSWELIQSRADGTKIRGARHPQNRGKGAAVATGLGLAKGDLVIVQDADLEYSPADYALLLDPIRSGRATVVYGIRTFASHSAYSFWYVIGNKLIALFTNLLYNSYIRDPLTCYKVLPRELALSLKLRRKGFDFDPEITAKLLRRGFRIYEVPITYSARSREEGKKVTPADGVRALLTLLRYRWL